MMRFVPISIFITVLAIGCSIGIQAQTEPAKAEKSAPSAKSPFDEITQFSATLNGGIGRDHDRKIYRSGNLMRADFPDHHRITEIDTRATWVIYPPAEATKSAGGAKPSSSDANTKPLRAGTCNKWFMADASTFPFVGLKDFKVERSMTDQKEMVDGHSARIEEVTFTSTGSSSSITERMKLWEAEDLKGFPVKIEAENMNNGQKYTLTYTNVSVDPPDPKLFAIPPHCDVLAASPVKSGTQPPTGKPIKKPAPKPAQKPPAQ